ncbi:hypothetical protein [Melaminivora alkalimesophila]|uniref:Uncharacterized protein n=1 Tax=Melaminivora alkalimesophila TaxID=1165852 RepID=A0A317RCT3_9BURK|nr:hypothetical protein [Melaminivora alkalimesophila]PWW46981.1 hypothetical protein DFR36_103256 [Melaminivora alkalimesophila]
MTRPTPKLPSSTRQHTGRSAPASGMARLLRRALRRWTQARRQAGAEQRIHNAVLHEARILADLSRAMNGIAVEDMRRYRF